MNLKYRYVDVIIVHKMFRLARESFCIWTKYINHAKKKCHLWSWSALAMRMVAQNTFYHEPGSFSDIMIIGALWSRICERFAAISVKFSDDELLNSTSHCYKQRGAFLNYLKAKSIQATLLMDRIAFFRDWEESYYKASTEFYCTVAQCNVVLPKIPTNHWTLTLL